MTSGRRATISFGHRAHLQEQLGTDAVPEIVRRSAIRSPGLERLGVGGDPRLR
jgi:hypothetical protein